MDARSNDNAQTHIFTVGVQEEMLNEIETMNEFEVDLQMTNTSIHFFRVGVQVDFLNQIRSII